jgi:hypothetical protein
MNKTNRFFRNDEFWAFLGIFDFGVEEAATQTKNEHRRAKG